MTQESAQQQSERSGYVTAIGAYLLWGLAPIFWKTISSVPALQITALRSTHTLVLLLGFLWLVRHQGPRSLFADRKSAIAHLIAGLLVSGNWVVFIYAVSTDRVVEASLGYFINPLITVVLGLIIFGERLSRVRWFAVGLACVGVFVIAVEGGRLPWISLVLAVSFAAYAVIKKQSVRGPIEGLALEMIWLAPLAVGYLAWLAVNGDYVIGVDLAPKTIWLIGFVTGAPLLLFAGAAKRIPLWAIGLMQYIAPTIQFLLGVLAYGEKANPTRLAGFAIIWIGLAVFASESLAQRKTD